MSSASQRRQSATSRGASVHGVQIASASDPLARGEFPASPMPKAAPKVKESHVVATFLIGREVAKEFKGIGTFKGRVSDFHRDTGFRVEYEDGDTEDLTEAALVSRLSARWLDLHVHPCVLPFRL